MAKVPGWAPTNKDRWPAGCTPHRDGWVRWYKGRTVFVCGKTTPPADVEDKWIAKKQAIDAAEADEALPEAGPVHVTYRLALSDFLARQKGRVGAARAAISERTYRNYVTDLNKFGGFVHRGRKVADLDLADVNRPAVFTAFAAAHRAWGPIAFDTLVTRLGTFFNWAVEMRLLDRWEPGPDFVRPDKAELRDERMGKHFSFTPDEVAKLWRAANHTQRCWIGLGCCAAFVNSDVANVTRSVIDLKAGVIDFRRRKTGKVRRVVPLPADVAQLLRDYERPDPASAADADVFFLTVQGNRYSRVSRTGQNCAISRTFGKLIEAAGVEQRTGRNFKGLRTTLYNRWPKAGYDTERMIVMGRAQGTIDLDHYLEDVGLERLAFGVNHVWSQMRAAIDAQQTTSS